MKALFFVRIEHPFKMSKKESEVLCFTPALAETLDGKYCDIGNKGDKLQCTTLAPSECREYGAQLFPTVL